MSILWVSSHTGRLHNSQKHLSHPDKLFQIILWYIIYLIIPLISLIITQLIWRNLVSSHALIFHLSSSASSFVWQTRVFDTSSKNNIWHMTIQLQNKIHSALQQNICCQTLIFYMKITVQRCCVVGEHINYNAYSNTCTAKWHKMVALRHSWGQNFKYPLDFKSYFGTFEHPVSQAKRLPGSQDSTVHVQSSKNVCSQSKRYAPCKLNTVLCGEFFINELRKETYFQSKATNLMLTYTLADCMYIDFYPWESIPARFKKSSPQHWLNINCRSIWSYWKKKVNFSKLISTQTIIAKHVVSFYLHSTEYYQYVIIVHSSMLLIGCIINMQLQEGWHGNKSGSSQSRGQTRTWICWYDQGSVQEQHFGLMIEIHPVGLIWEQQCTMMCSTEDSSLENRAVSYWQLNTLNWGYFSRLLALEHLNAFTSASFSGSVCCISGKTLIESSI